MKHVLLIMLCIMMIACGETRLENYCELTPYRTADNYGMVHKVYNCGNKVIMWEEL